MTEAVSASPPRVRRTARRLGTAFVAVLLLFAAAMLMSLRTHARISAAMEQVAHLDHAKHTGHYAAALVREQYIHQAHMIIQWSRDHMPRYERARAATLAATEQLLGFADSGTERRLAEQLASLAEESDAVFRRGALLAIDRDDRSALRAHHDDLEKIVNRVVALNDELNKIFETRSAEARAAAHALRDRSRVILVACFALAIALSAIVGVQIVRSIARPIAALRDGAHRIGGGDLSARIDVSSGDEFGELAASFNQMAEDLSRNQGELVRSQRLASIGQLAAGVAHEINNPLGVILGYAKLMRRDDDGSKVEELRIIEDEARQCQTIVQSLLELARTPKLELSEVDLAAVARDAVSRLDEAGKLAGISVELPSRAVDGRLIADEVRIRQVLSNILVNAAEASEGGGRIEVRVGRADGGFELVVADNGVGISDDARAHLFEPFYTTKADGTGLGLAIANGIAEAHGGRLTVESAPAEGTEVTLWLPKEPAFSSPTTKRTS